MITLERKICLELFFRLDFLDLEIKTNATKISARSPSLSKPHRSAALLVLAAALGPLAFLRVMKVARQVHFCTAPAACYSSPAIVYIAQTVAALKGIIPTLCGKVTLVTSL